MKSSRAGILLGIYLLVALLVLSGCSDGQIRRAEEISDKANETLVVAAEALKVAKDLAEATKSEEAQNAVAAAQKAFEVAAEAARRGEDAVVAAKKEQAAGGATWRVIGAAVLAALGGWQGAALLARQAVGRAMTAVKLTASYADSVETSETDDDVLVAKESAKQAQLAAGVHDLIQKARGKVA